MLASVYSYRVMVKSVSSCCVHGRQVLSNPVTSIIHILDEFKNFAILKREKGLKVKIYANNLTIKKL